uniref:Uncharacterized protein n=1 Tax=Anguilla anguilla TaxID=7936 RepID=A0A0E9QDN0_ANGAN
MVDCVGQSVGQPTLSTHMLVPRAVEGSVPTIFIFKMS